MKELKLETRVEVYAVGELDNIYRQLYEAAFEASKKAYAPYSKFHVGAAVLLENPSGLCAERTTLFYAGARYPDAAVQILAIAAMKDGERVDLITPCGACRQVMLETEQRYNKPMKVLLCGKEEAYLVPSATALLPFCFSKSDLI